MALVASGIDRERVVELTESSPPAISRCDVMTPALELDTRLQLQLLNSLGEAVIVTDTSGVIVFWNAFAEQLYGWRADEVLGQHIFDVTVDDSVVGAASELMERLVAGET